MIKRLIFEPEFFFESLRESSIERKDLVGPAIIVALTGLINPLTVFYIHGEVSYSFVLFSILISIAGWTFFSVVVHKISETLSGFRRASFINLLYGLGASRLPMLIFLFTMAFVCLKHNVNIVSSRFAMVYVISVLWMFYLYGLCVSKLYGLSFLRSIFAVIFSFIAITMAMSLLGRAFGWVSLSIPILS